jgi:hypothetical protein
MSDAPKKPRGRPRSFQLVQNAHGKVGGRVTRTIDGETVRRRVRLETSDDDVARVKLRRLSREPGAPVEAATARETFLEEAERIGRRRTLAGKVRAGDELGKILLHARALHDVPVTSVTSDDINVVLDQAMARGLGKSSVKNLKVAISVVFSALVRERASPVKNNPARGASLPEFEKKPKKIRAVLEDAELFRYLDFVHPVAFHQVAVFQRQVMSAVARCLGGQRTNDLHECRWEQFVVAEGEFPSALVLRTKAQQLERMVVPAVLRPFLRAWWEAQKRPSSGLIFPTLRGERLGQVKIKMSHARAFRQDLRRAFGVEVWAELPREPGERPGRGAPRVGWVVARDLTERERELFIESPYTKPVDFHSWRRAFVQAVDATGLSPGESRKLSGHEDEAVRQVYLQRTKRREWVVPAGALPERTGAPGGILGQLPALIQEGGFSMVSDSSVIPASYPARPEGFEPSTFGSVDKHFGEKAYKNIENGPEADSVEEAKTPHHAEPGLNSRPKIPSTPALTEDELTELHTLASKAKRWPLVASLSVQLAALAASHLDPSITNIADARDKRRPK